MLDCSPHKKLIYTKEELEKVEVNVIDTKPPNESLFMMQNSTTETLIHCSAFSAVKALSIRSIVPIGNQIIHCDASTVSLESYSICIFPRKKVQIFHDWIRLFKERRMKHMIEIFIFAQFRALCPIANRKRSNNFCICSIR